MLKNFKFILILFAILANHSAQAFLFETKYHNMPAHIEGAKTFPDFWNSELGVKEVESYIRHQTMLDDKNNPFWSYRSVAKPWSERDYLSEEISVNLVQYSNLLREYDKANGFGKRRVKRQLTELVLNKFSNNKLFESIKGKKLLIEVPMKSGLAFDFDGMSKSFIVNGTFCSAANVKEPRISHEKSAVNYVLQPLASPIEFLAQGRRTASCKVEVPFGEDEVTAEKVETVFADGALKIYAVAEFVGYGLGNKPLAIVDGLVFVESKMSRYGQEDLTYLTEIKSSATKYTPENILSSVLLDEMLTTEKQMSVWLKQTFSKDSVTGFSSSHEHKGLMRLNDGGSHIELLYSRVDGAKTVGGFSRYKIIKTQVGYYFKLTATSGTNIYHSPLLIPTHRFNNYMATGQYAANQPSADISPNHKDRRFYASKSWDDMSLKVGYVEGSEKAFVSTLPLIELSGANNVSKSVEKKEQHSAKASKSLKSKLKAVEFKNVGLNSEYKQQCSLKLDDKGGFFSGQHYVGKQAITAPKDYVFARIKQWMVENDQEVGENVSDDAFVSYQVISEGKRYTTTVQIQGDNLTLEFKTYAGVSISKQAVNGVWCDMIAAI